MLVLKHRENQHEGKHLPFTFLVGRMGGGLRPAQGEEVKRSRWADKSSQPLPRALVLSPYRGK